MNGNVRRYAAFALIGLTPAASVHAAWVVQPTVEARTSYDDNVRLNIQGAEDGGMVNEATVQARVANVTETSRAAGVIGVSFTDYSGTENTEDSDNQFIQFIYEKNFERGSLGGTLSANRDSVLRWSSVIREPFNAQEETELDAELNDLANNVDDLDRSVIREQLERIRVRVSPRASYSINALTRAVFNYNYYQSDYEDEQLADQFGVQNTKSHNVTMGLFRTLSELSSVEVNVGARKLDPDESEGADAYSVDVGYRRQVSERTNVRLSVGVNRVSPDGPADDNDGYSGRLEINHTTSKGRLRVALRRDLYPSSFGTILESDTLQMDYRHQFSARLAASLRIQGVSSASDNVNSWQDRDFVQFSPEIFYALTENWQVSAGYQYSWNERDVESDDAASNSVFLSIRYQPRREVR